MQILDERQFENFEIGGGANDDGHLREPCFLCRAPPAFARDQFMFAGNIPHHEWLNDSVLPDRFDQLAQRFSREIFPGLQWARHDRRQIDALNFFPRFSLEPKGRRPRANQRAKTFAESRLRHALQVIGSDVPRQTKTCLIFMLLIVILLLIFFANTSYQDHEHDQQS